MRSTDSSLIWAPMDVPAAIPHGDMPGDSIQIGPDHVKKANVLMPALLPLLQNVLETNPQSRAVISVCGGSGVGKSEIASVLGFYLREMGIGSYILSGDNYPRRIPRDNDLERLRVFRVGGLRGLLDSGLYTDAMTQPLHALWDREADADPREAETLPWLAIYQSAGRLALADYLGTPRETDFDEVNALIARFRQGAPALPLKRMGREITALWYDTVDLHETKVLLIEWTHGNSDYLRGVDIPILLNSTPAETLAHRKARNRDGKTDSPFTTMVLEIEQKKLEHQAQKARLILSKSGELMSYADYRHLMAEEG